MSAPVMLVLDALAAESSLQGCCGCPVGGGMDDRGNGESPQCCGNPVTAEDVRETRDSVMGLIAAATRVITSFTALGEAGGIEQNIIWKRECERAMTGLASALAKAVP